MVDPSDQGDALERQPRRPQNGRHHDDRSRHPGGAKRDEQRAQKNCPDEGGRERNATKTALKPWPMGERAYWSMAGAVTGKKKLSAAHEDA